MTIQVISYKYTLHREVKRILTETLINESKADLILFPGWALNSEEDVRALKIKNNSVIAVIDVKTMGATEQYLIQEGKAVKRKSQQVFTTSTEATIENVEALLDTMQEEPRQFSVAEKNCLLLVCGETNILYKPKGGTIGFRYPNDTKLLSRFNKLMKQTNIVLNPMHSPWRRHADLKARILYLSKGRYFFGTSNTCKKISLKAHLIYAFHNEEELIGKEEIQSQYRSTIYNI